MSEVEPTYNYGDSIKCPSCRHVIRDLCDYELQEDDSTDIECEGDGCGVTYTLSCSVSVSYKASVKNP